MELKKLHKLIAKLERRYDTAGKIQQKRIMKKAEAIQKRIDFLTR